jgi:hypothetical protein
MIILSFACSVCRRPSADVFGLNINLGVRLDHLQQSPTEKGASQQPDYFFKPIPTHSK